MTLERAAQVAAIISAAAAIVGLVWAMFPH